MKYKISYIISTKNRLPFLKILYNHIILNLLDDEEIIIVDGNSNDGSREFLEHLHNKGLIHQYISETDINQAHGWNKGFLMARGEFIKKIIDDDVHDLDAIRKSVNYMVNNPELEFLISNCLVSATKKPKYIRQSDRFDIFLKYHEGKIHCFTFSDVYLIIRRSVLSKYGLFDTQFRMMDWEYSLRCSYMGAKIAFYRGCLALAVDTPSNITSTALKKTLKRESNIGQLKYNYLGDRASISWYSEFKIATGKIFYLIKNLNRRKPHKNELPNDESLKEIYDNYYQYLKNFNKQEFDIIF